MAGKRGIQVQASHCTRPIPEVWLWVGERLAGVRNSLYKVFVSGLEVANGGDVNGVIGLLERLGRRGVGAVGMMGLLSCLLCRRWILGWATWDLEMKW